MADREALFPSRNSTGPRPESHSSSKRQAQFWFLAILGSVAIFLVGLPRVSFSSAAAKHPGQGGSLVYASNRTGNYELYLVTPLGHRHRLTRTAGAEFSPALSPTGGLIAYVSKRAGGSDEIFTIRGDGTHRHRLTHDVNEQEQPCFTPDGTRILFSSGGDIWQMDRAGSHQVDLTGNGLGNVMPAIAPDGKRIAFASQRMGNLEIFSMNRDGSGQVNLTKNPADDFSPAYSPNGSLIYFASSRVLASQIYRMRPNGSNPVAFSSGSETGTDPAPAPDGHGAAFVRGGRILYQSAVTETPRLIANAGRLVSGLDWASGRFFNKQ